MIEARDVLVRYRGRTVLDRISIVAERGAITVLAGPNGAGKSTLLKTLAGLVSPVSGSVLVEGQSAHVVGRDAMAKRLAYLPQERDVHWPLPVRGTVSLGRIPHLAAGTGLTPRDTQAIDDAMTAMDVLELADRPVTELSGGERARALMARALAQQPEILLADEPTSGLDPSHQLMLFQHLTRIAAGGVAVVVALHDLSLAARFGHKIVLMKSGQIAACGTPDEVLIGHVLSPVYGVRMVEGLIEGHPVVLAGDLAS